MIFKHTIHISVSLFVSTIFWLAIVSSQQNIKSYEQKIPAKFLNIPEGSSVDIEAPLVEIKIDTEKESNKKISPENFQVSVDFSDTKVGTKNFPIYVKSQDPLVRIVSYKPEILHANLEPIEEKSISPELKFEGSISPNYAITSSRLKDTIVTVKAGSSILSKIQNIRAVVSLQGEEGNILKKVPFQAFDENNQVLPYVQILPAETEVEILLTQINDSKIVGIKVPIEGNLKTPNMYVKSLTISPSVTEIRAKKTVLDRILHVQTASINLSEITESKTLTQKIIVPLGADLVDTKQVTVSIVLDTLTKQEENQVSENSEASKEE